MSKSHASNFSAQYKEEYFPPALLERYIPMELLADKGHMQTFLLKEKLGGRQIVAKRFGAENPLTKEDLLPRLSHEGLPIFVEKIRTMEHTYILREYVPGIPLDQYAKTPLPEKQAVEIGQKLCGALAYLHGLNPPVIHRDIKPCNIIIEPESAKITLIDFDIARRYTPDAKNDTIFMGTQSFSPPEQYGYSQTDNRSDIYALGVVLCWMLTGESNTTEAADRIRSEALRRIVRRCTAFDPAKRYTSVVKVQRDLKYCCENTVKKAAVMAAAACAAFVLFGGGYVAGRYTQTEIPPFDNLFERTVVFNDPVLEERVRAGMQTPDGDIAAVQAEKVAKLDLSAADPGVPEENKIRDISALAHFKNLKSLDLSWNRIDDITPLARLDKLEKLYLNGNGSIRSLTPLEGLVNMKEIMFVGCRVNSADLQSCARMDRLEIFWVESVFLKDAGIVSNFPNLRKLVFKECGVNDIAPVSGLVLLEDINLEDTPVSDLSPLLSLRSLKTAAFSKDMRAQAEQQLSGAQFEIIYH